MLHFMLNIHQFNSFPRKFVESMCDICPVWFMGCGLSSGCVDKIPSNQTRGVYRLERLRYSQYSPGWTEQRKYPSDNCWLVTSLMLWYSDWIKKMNKILHKSDNSTFLFRLDKRSNWIILEYLNNCVGQVLNTEFYEYFGINLWISEFYRVNKNSVGGLETGQQQILFWFLTTSTNHLGSVIGFQEFSNSWYILGWFQDLGGYLQKQ